MRIEEEETESNEVVLNELRSMIIQTLNFPLPSRSPFPTPSSHVASSSTSKRQSSSSSSWWTALLSTSPQDSPATFAALFLGISVAFMIFGSAIFLVGLLMFPWVILILMLFYFAAFLSNLSFFGRRFILASIGIALAQAQRSST